jgi:fatty acid-binding protein DegV
LNIKPIIGMSQGDTETIATARGFDHAVEKLLQIAAAAIDSGLQTDTVVLSYAGDPWVQEPCRQARGKALESSMSTTAGVNVGPAAISLAYAV